MSYITYDKRKAVPGERILIVKADPQEERIYRDGAIFTVMTRFEKTDMVKTTCDRFIDDTEYVVIVPEGDTV